MSEPDAEAGSNEDPFLTTPADLLVKVAELGAQAQNAVLMAEMQVLARMIPGIATLTVPHTPATDAEVEDGFDNMPV